MPLPVRALLFTIFFPGTVAGVVPTVIILTTRPAPSPTLVAPAALLLAGGFCLYLWTVVAFARHGRGTPGPWDPPRRLVTTGPYRVSRSPMYVGVLGVIAGLAAFYASAWLAGYAAFVWLAFNFASVIYEEPTLRRLFGYEYEAYRARTPRWVGLRSLRLA